MAKNVKRQLGVDAAIVLQYGTPDQATARGINKHTLPSLTRAKITSEEFGVDFSVNDAGGGAHGDYSYAGNEVVGDSKGQDQIRAYFKNNTKFTDARIYIDTKKGDFIAPDLANDSEAGFQVLEHTPSETGKNSTYAFTGKWTINGLYAIFTVHKKDSDTSKLAFVAAVTPGTTSPTITDTGNGFVTAGFKEGQTLIIDGSTSNDGIYRIITVTAGTLTLNVEDALTSEPAVEEVTTLHGGAL